MKAKALGSECSRPATARLRTGVIHLAPPPHLDLLLGETLCFAATVTTLMTQGGPNPHRLLPSSFGLLHLGQCFRLPDVARLSQVALYEARPNTKLLCCSPLFPHIPVSSTRLAFAQARSPASERSDSFERALCRRAHRARDLSRVVRAWPPLRGGRMELQLMRAAWIFVMVDMAREVSHFSR